MPLTYIRDLVDGAEDLWGKPQENIGRVVPWGFHLMDKAFIAGVPINAGGMLSIYGKPGSRKTSFVINIIINQCLSGRLPPGYHIAYDTLESGMTIERIADVFISILATKFLMYWHWNQTEERDIRKLLASGLPTDMLPDDLVMDVTENGSGSRRETVIRPEFFQIGMPPDGTWTARQKHAIDMARSVARNFPLFIFGVSEHRDPEVAKGRSTTTIDLDESYKRWVWLAKEKNCRQIVVDHLGEYVFGDTTNDFEIQKRFVSTANKWMKPNLGLIWAVAQMGIGSETRARQFGSSTYPIGGWPVIAESMCAHEIQYDASSPFITRLRRPTKSRIGMHNELVLFTEPNSGAFFGQAVEYRRYIDGND